jgi:hypothetical protein
MDLFHVEGFVTNLLRVTFFWTILPRFRFVHLSRSFHVGLILSFRRAASRLPISTLSPEQLDQACMTTWPLSHGRCVSFH